MENAVVPYGASPAHLAAGSGAISGNIVSVLYRGERARRAEGRAERYLRSDEYVRVSCVSIAVSEKQTN